MRARSFGLMVCLGTLALLLATFVPATVDAQDAEPHPVDLIALFGGIHADAQLSADLPDASPGETFGLMVESAGPDKPADRNPVATAEWYPAALTSATISAPYCDQALTAAKLSADSYVCVDGDAEDWVSGGHNWVFAAPTDTIAAWPSADANVLAACSFTTEGVCVEAGGWAFAFKPPLATALHTGLYAHAAQVPWAAPQAGIVVTSPGRYCDESAGAFEVLALEVDALTGAVTRFAANFEQRCAGADAGLRGYVRYNAGNAGAG